MTDAFYCVFGILALGSLTALVDWGTDHPVWLAIICIFLFFVGMLVLDSASDAWEHRND